MRGAATKGLVVAVVMAALALAQTVFAQSADDPPAQASQVVCLYYIQLPGGPAPGDEEPPPPPPPGGEPGKECPAVRASRSHRFIGIGGGDSLNAMTTADRSCILNEQVESGVGFLRQNFDWAQIEQKKGKYDLSLYDQWVAAAATHGLRVLPILFNPPRFRWAGPRKGEVRGTWRPKRASDLGRLAQRLIHRYGPDGSLWTDPKFEGTPKVPITAWQIWNEPNLKVYWQPKASPEEYAQMMRVVYPMMKKADPKAEVVSAGLPDSRFSNPDVWTWLDRFYAAGGAKGIDAVAFHAYAHDARGVFDKLRRVREVMAANGDRRAGLWVTEVGWATKGPKSVYTLRENQVVTEIGSLFRRFAKNRRELRLRGVTYYTWRDKEPYPPRYQDIWGLHAGLLHVDGAKKRTYYAFRRAAGKLAASQ
jgi:hypothetical protein